MPRPLQDMNAGTMADIAFLLLIFFLLTTTMDVDQGISRKLPPPLPPNQPKPPEIKERNIYIVLLNSYDGLFVETKEVTDLNELKNGVKEFILNPTNDPGLSEKTEKYIPALGKMMVSKGVVSLRNDRSTSYEKYIEVQNELVKAFNELRNEFALKHFGMPFSELDRERQNGIRELYPQSISEAEPIQVKAK